MERVEDTWQLADIANGGVGHDRQVVLEGRRDGCPAHWRVEVHGAHAAALRAVDVDVEVVADEHDLLELHIETRAELLEDGRYGLAVTVLVGEDHGVDGWADAEETEHFAERGSGRAPRVADQAQAIAARLQPPYDIVRAGDQLRQHINGGVGVGVFERHEGLLAERPRLKLQSLEEVVDLPPAGNV